MTDRQVLNAFVAAIGVLSAVVSVLALQEDQKYLQMLSGLSIAMTALIAVGIVVRRRIYRRWRARMLFLEPEVLDEVSASYHLRQATEADIGWIASQQAEVYSARDAIPADILMEWFKVNPSGFFIICDRRHNSIGHLDLLPIKLNTLERLRCGEIRERDVRGDSLHPPSDKAQITDLWIESIMLKEANPHRRARAILSVMRRAPRMISRLADPNRLRNYYAISATEAGDSLLNRLGFQKDANVDQRADKHFLHQASSECVQQKMREFAAKS